MLNYVQRFRTGLMNKKLLKCNDESKNIEFNTIYKYEGYYDTDRNKVIGELKHVKELKNKNKLEKMGINITY